MSQTGPDLRCHLGEQQGALYQHSFLPSSSGQLPPSLHPPLHGDKQQAWAEPASFAAALTACIDQAADQAHSRAVRYTIILRVSFRALVMYIWYGKDCC